MAPREQGMRSKESGVRIKEAGGDTFLLSGEDGTRRPGERRGTPLMAVAQ